MSAQEQGQFVVERHAPLSVDVFDFRNGTSPGKLLVGATYDVKLPFLGNGSDSFGMKLEVAEIGQGRVVVFIDNNHVNEAPLDQVRADRFGDLVLINPVQRVLVEGHRAQRRLLAANSGV